MTAADWITRLRAGHGPTAHECRQLALLIETALLVIDVQRQALKANAELRDILARGGTL